VTVTAKQIVIIQRDGFTYCRKYTAGTYDVTGGDQGNKTFTIAEDVACKFVAGSTFTITGAVLPPGNNGDYTCAIDATGDGPITITVSEIIPSATFDGAIGAIFTKRDAQAIDYDAETDGGAEFTLWENATDYMYVGHSKPFAWVGFRPQTVGVGYGNFTFEYWDGDSWESLSTLLNSTIGFTRAGYVAFSIPGDWALTTNGDKTQSAFWVRASQDEASPATPAKAYNLLRNVTLDRPVVIQPIHTTSRFIMDVNRLPRLKDVARTTPDRLVIDATHLALIMSELNMLWDCFDQRRPVFVWDGTFTSANPSFTADAYYESYEAYIDVMPPRAMSPSKMEPFEYTIEFICGVVKTIADRLGANA